MRETHYKVHIKMAELNRPLGTHTWCKGKRAHYLADWRGHALRSASASLPPPTATEAEAKPSESQHPASPAAPRCLPGSAQPSSHLWCQKLQNVWRSLTQYDTLSTSCAR